MEANKCFNQSMDTLSIDDLMPKGFLAAQDILPKIYRLAFEQEQPVGAAVRNSQSTQG